MSFSSLLSQDCNSVDDTCVAITCDINGHLPNRQGIISVIGYIDDSFFAVSQFSPKYSQTLYVADKTLCLPSVLYICMCLSLLGGCILQYSVYCKCHIVRYTQVHVHVLVRYYNIILLGIYIVMHCIKIYYTTGLSIGTYS